MSKADRSASFAWDRNPWVWAITFKIADGPLPEGRRERPILFRGELVRAILAGTKTQTRRPVKPAPPSVESVCQLAGIDWHPFNDGRCHDRNGAPLWRVAGPVWAVRQLMGLDPVSDPAWRCPYGAPGDRLWVKETHGFVSEHEGRELEDARAGMPWAAVVFGSDRAWLHDQPKRWRPSIHMPRWASRLSLEVVSVRVERLHAITEEDARAEGVTIPYTDWTYRDAFAAKWREIHGGPTP